jgi:vacuolar iron transporter family protein
MALEHRHHHVERHFTAADIVRDAVMGMADGLTVPFALAAGLTGAVDATWIIVVAGLAEIAAGALAMGLGGYLAAKGEAEHYASERAREHREVHTIPEAESEEVSAMLQVYGLTPDEAAPVVAALRKKPEAWIDFMMRFELGLEKPDPRRARFSAVTIGGAYAVGGIIPLAPYMVLARPGPAVAVSAVVTLLALLVFGYVKARFTGARPGRSALQTALIGGLAAAAAYTIARAVS